MNRSSVGDADESSGLLRLGRTDPSSAASRPPPRRRWITRWPLPLSLLAGFAALGLYTAGESLRPATPVRVVPVIVRQVGPTSPAAGATQRPAPSGEVVAQASGWVEPAPYAVVVNALADGVVQEVRVLEGQAVQAGDALATLIPDDAMLARARAEAAVRQAEATVVAARARWDNPTDRRRAVAVAEAQVAESEAELAKLAFDVAIESARAEELAVQNRQVEANLRSSAATETEAATSRQRLLAQQATLASTQGRRDVLAAQLAVRRAELRAATEDARLRIDESHRLATAEAALAEARAALEEAALRVTRMTVRAPVDGVVLSRHVEPGAKLHLGGDDARSAAIVRLYDPSQLQVRVDVPLAAAAGVGVGMAAEVVVSVLPERAFAGRVVGVAHEADVTRNTLQVKVAIERPDPALRPEMLARVRLIDRATGEADRPPRPVASAGGRTAVFAPRSLLHRDGAGEFAWVNDPAAAVARRRAVTRGSGEVDGWVEIASGLVPGDRLIVDADGLADGASVRVTGDADAPTAEGGSDAVR